MIFLAVLAGWVAVLALLTALVAVLAPVIRAAAVRSLPRLVYAASFAATWVVVLASRHVGRPRP